MKLHRINFSFTTVGSTDQKKVYIMILCRCALENAEVRNPTQNVQVIDQRQMLQVKGQGKNLAGQNFDCGRRSTPTAHVYVTLFVDYCRLYKNSAIFTAYAISKLSVQL